MDHSPTRIAVDASIIGGTTIGALANWLPPIAAAIGLIWGCICIADWVSDGAFGRWVRKKVMGK